MSKPPSNEQCQVSYCDNYASDIDDCLYVTDNHGWVCAICLPEIASEEEEEENA